MSIGVLRFDGHDFPHNPEKMKITQKQTNGKSTVSVTGEGELYGANVQQQSRTLKELFCNGKTCVLCVPADKVYNAKLTQLELAITATPNLISYSFCFEAEEITLQNDELLYTAETVDTVWTLSRKLGCTVDTLVKENGGIINGIVINTGDKVIIPGSRKADAI